MTSHPAADRTSTARTLGLATEPLRWRPGAVRLKALARLGLGLAAATTLLAAAAAPAWVWQDDAGRKVYSDLPPPTSVPERLILQKPSERAPEPPAPPAGAVSGATVAAPAPPTPSAPGLPKDPALEKRRLEAEAAEQAKQRAIDKRNAQIRADNCDRARSARATIESGARLATTNADGQRVVMDAAMREAELQRLQAIIDESCR